MTEAYEETLFRMIEDYWVNDPRTLQKAIGPSGLGTDCFHCLGAMLAQEPKVESPEDGWRSFVGKCVHEGLAKAAARYNRVHTDRFLIEERVHVGRIGTLEVHGNADVFDTWTSRVIDWKVTGNKTIASVKEGRWPPTYTGQADIYGYGFEELGMNVEGTTILFLPLEKWYMRQGAVIHRPYDRANAEACLKRARDIQELLDTRGPAYVLPRLKRKAGCYTCPKYAR